MNIEDIIQLLNNRLREFKLSRDYASMSGNLEGMNAADKEIISLEDTLFKLNLLIDTSKSAAVKETTLAEVITDGSVSVLGEYDITPYATDPLHEEKIMNILSKMGVMETAEKIDDYIKDKYWSSPVTGEMIMNAASAYSVDARLMMAIMEQDSRFGTAGVAVRTLNPGNVGNNDAGDTVTYESWQEGVTAVARWLSRHRASTIISEIPDTATSTPVAATPVVGSSATTTGQASTPPIIIPTATTTTTTATSTPTTATSTPVAATSTPPIIIPTATTTTTTATSTPAIDTATPVAATSTPEILPVTTSTTTTTTATSTPTTATSTPVAATPVVGSSATTTGQASTPPIIIPTTTSTPETATSQPEAGPPLAETPEIPPVTTSTTTTTTTTSTE